MIRNLTAIGKALLLPYLFILCLLVVPATSFGQRKLNVATHETKSSTSPKEAQANRDKNLSQQGISPLEQFKNKKEDVAKRDLFSKHFINGDGSNTAVIGAGPIHYPKNGQFLDINHTITTTGNTAFPYANTTNLMESHFGATAHQGVKNSTIEGEVVEFLNTKMYWEVAGQAVQTRSSSNVAITINADKAYYKNLYGAIDAEFAIESGRRKLNYVIPTRAALGNIPSNADYLVFTEDVVLPQGWNYKVDSKKGITLYNNSGKLAYLYENPVSIDATNLPEGDNTSYSITQNRNVLTIATKVKLTWLTDNQRVYPIKIDPTVNVLPSYNPDTHSTGQANSNGGGTYGDIAVGRNSGSILYRGWASFNTNAIPDNVTINSASLSVRVGTINGSLAAKGAMLRAFTGNPDNDYSTYTQIYNAIENFAAYNVTIIGLTATGWQNNIALPAAALTQIKNGLTNDRYSIGFGRTGNWNASQNMVINGYQSANPPFLTVEYILPNQPPACATLISPTNGATDASPQGNVSWNAAAGATSYDVYFGTAGSPPLVSTSQTGTTYNVGTCLLPNTTYYWRVVPKNANGSATGCATWSFTTDGKLNIYANNWETASLGVFGTSGAGVDGWLTNNNSATGGAWNNGYNNAWTVGNGTNAINGNSIGISALDNGGLAGSYFQYWSDLGEIHRWIYRPFDMRGLRDIEVSFRWKAGGEANQDYGSVISSINGGANWTMETQGGLNNDGRYWNSPSTIRSQSIVFPETRNNQQNFRLAFKWDDMSGNGYSSDPSFVVDDIVVKACPYEGNIISNQVTQGIYEWIPLSANTETTLSITDSHSCALFQWEQSIDGGVTWMNVIGGSGATTSSYTTPSNVTASTLYRAKVYYGTGCPGAYQANAFEIKIIVLCDAAITAVTAVQNTICNGSNTTLTAVANDIAHEIRWYTTATGGTPIATGSSFTTPNLIANTTYYAAAYDGECESNSRQAITITVNAAPSSVSVAIGTPANGTNHYVNVTWSAITGATQYQIDYSWDNTNWSTGGFSTTTTLNLNLFDNPNRIVYIRVKRYDNGGLPDCFTYATPIYTAADIPAPLVLNNPTGTSMQVTLGNETPVANPAITTYSLFNETLGLYVQADGSLGVTEVFQTKAAWGTTTVTGLTAETEYCFYAKAKNEDGDVRYTPATTLLNQEFNSNVLTVGGNAGINTWFAPNSNPPFVFNNSGCNGGRVGYENNTTTTWGNFLRTPAQNLIGQTEVIISFTMSNSYIASNPTGNYMYINYWDTAYRSTNVTSIKINGVPYTATGTTGGRINFDVLRACDTVEMTFSLNPANNLSQVYFYWNVTKANTTGFHFWIDDFKMANGSSFSSPDAVCLTTGPDCDALITSVTNGSGCAGILLQATASAETTAFNWYDAATEGTLLATTATGQWTTPVINATTTYYVAATNGECESARIAVTATKTTAEAELMYWTPNATSCKPAQVTLYAETMDDAMEVNWYTTATGGTPFYTGYELNYSITNTTTLYIAATDGTCESPREPIAITLEGRVWNGSVSSDWSNPNNWTPAILPTLNECVVIPQTTNSPILTGNGEAKSLSLLANAELLVTTGSSIKVYEEVNVASTADFTLENDAYLVQVIGGQTNNNVGNITVHRNSEPMFRLEATGWSSPVENQGLYAFSPQTVSGRIYEYNETTNAFDNTNITNNSVFARGKGYSVRAPNTFPTYTGSATPRVFEGTYFGKPNNGTIGVSVTKNSNGNNYIGNPYPSPIDAYMLLENNASLESLHFWTHEAPPISGAYAANNYASYTLMGATTAAAGGQEPDGMINVGQGFIAKTNQSVLVQFTNDLRMDYSYGQFFRRPATERHRFWLNLTDDQANYNQILLGYIQNATNAFDHKIDGKLFGHSGSAIYSILENDKYVIQGRSLPFDATDIIPLGFKAMQQGIYTISIDHMDGLFQEGEATIYLKDKLSNITHNLSEGNYNFVSEAGTFENRFEIVYQAETLGIQNPEMNNNNWIAFKSEGKLHIQSTGFDIESLEVFDITGRLLIQKNNVNSQSFECPAHFADQVLVVKVNKTLAKKVL